MSRSLSKVSRHTSADSCWIILYGEVYDVTDFLNEHPGGASIILRLAGTDATEEFEPVHPSGTLDEGLSHEAKLGPVDPDSLARLETRHRKPKVNEAAKKDHGINLPALLNTHDVEEAASQVLSKKARSCTEDI